MPEHTIPETLINQIRTGRAVLVVGAGIGVSSWKQLLETMNEELRSRGGDGDDAAVKDVAKLLHKGNLVRAAGFLARGLGEETCDRIVREAWANVPEVTPIAAALAKLPFRQVWTTFPGDLMELALGTELPDGWPESEVKTYQQAAEINPRRRLLLKILGDFDSYVVTPKSVRRALAGARDLHQHAGEYYSDGGLVFVGFRFGDPDLSALLDRVFGQFETPKSEHYMVASGVGPVTVEELHFEHNIEVINLAGKGADETATSALLEYLEALARACADADVTLATGKPDADDLEGWIRLLTEDVANSEAIDALAAMETLATEQEEADRLIEVLIARVEVEPEESARAEMLRRLANVYETMVGDLPAAFTALTAALREHPIDTTAVDEAERLADETEGWAELVSDVSEVAAHIEDCEVAGAYWARLGRWYHEKLHHIDYAIASYRQAVKLDPESTKAHAGLGELYRKQQRWAELADVLKTQVELEEDIDKKVDLYLSLGDLNETQLASTSGAIESYQAAVDLEEDRPGASDDALAAVERLYRRDERWGKLATILEKRAERFEETGEIQRAGVVRRELATLRAEKLGDLEGAIAKYEAALDSNSDDLDALHALEDMYERVGRTGDYLRILGRLVDLVPQAERVPLLRRLAAELEEREEDRDKAVESYERLIELDPNAEDGFRALERMFRNTEKWYELVAIYERHIAIIKAPALRIALYLEMASVFDSELDDPHRAIESYLAALALGEDNDDSLHALARLYKRTENWDRAAEILVRHAELRGAADLWFEAGQVTAEQRREAEAAEGYYEKALAIDGNHLRTTLGLAKLHEEKGSWATAVSFLASAEKLATNRLERVELLNRAAGICDNQLNDSDRCLVLLQEVLRLDPEHVESGLLVAERLAAAERWTEAVPILEMLARQVEDDDKIERARRQADLGRAYQALGAFDKAAQHYRGAVEADPDVLEAAVGLASMLYAEASDSASDPTVDKWQEVDKRYREILARHRTGLADGQVVEIWYRLGVIAGHLGDDPEYVKKADNAFRRALERDPHHAPSLRAMIDVAEARGDWKTVVETKRDQLEAADDNQKVILFTEIGDIYRDRLDDPVAALGAYLEAIKMAPDSHSLLHNTLEIYTEQKQWRRAIDTLSTLASHESESARRAKYRYAAAVIARDEVNDIDLAVEQFNLTLDDVPTTPKAFDAIDALLTRKKDWKNLARAYRRMLKRVGEDAPTSQLLRLWTHLGELCAEHLNDNDAAIAAFEVASSLDPLDMARHEQLANLYLEAGDSRRHDAIEELQVLIQNDPDRFELYRALSNLYQEEQDLDKSYCLAQALVFLGAATDEERALYEKYRPQQFVPAKRRLTEELWQKSIIHGKENRHVNAIFSSIVGAIAATTAQPAAAFNLDAGQRADAETDPHLISRVFSYAISVLGLEPPPHLYLQSDDVGIRVANTTENGKLVPSVLVGNAHCGKKDERELAFEVGKRLAYFRPERYMNYALQTLPKLEGAFSAAMTASGRPLTNGKAMSGDSEKLVGHLRAAVPRAVLDQVGTLAGRLGVTETNGIIAGWRTATDLTANRVGLILSNDLNTSARLVATEAGGMSTLSAKDRLRDLLVYSVSESYFGVRRHLGLDVAEVQ